MIIKTLKKIVWNIIELKNKYRIIVKANKYYKIPFSKRLFSYMHGFQSDEYVQYGLAKKDYREYITEYERIKTRNVNGEYKFVMDNKLVYNEVFGKYIRVPEIFLWIKNGIIYHISSDDDAMSLLKKEKKLVIKPIAAGGGTGVRIFKYENECIYCDEKSISEEEFFRIIKSYNQAIVTEFIVQGEFGKSLFEKTVNTIRMVVAKGKNDVDYKILAAVQRVGREASIPVDNLCNGGLCCVVDIETGRLSKGISYVNKDGSALTPYANHPDTGALLEGVHIPEWESIKEQVLNISRKFPYINFFAWDIVITDDGLVAIEVNASSSLQMFQLENGIRNTEFGEVYKSYGIIR